MYTLSVDAAADYSSELDFWEAKQQLFVHCVAGDWYVFAVGQKAPPLTWKPKRAAGSRVRPPAAGAAEAEASKGVADAFSACMGALLKKDADGALAFMAQEIRFLRLRQSVTAAELKTSLQGSLENSADIGSSQLGEVLDMDSVFIERDRKPRLLGQRHGLSLSVSQRWISPRQSLSGRTLQRYYFIDEGGKWKIFAIL